VSYACPEKPTHERFAQFLASGKSAKDAYAAAGYKPSDSNGAWLARKDEISSRVAEISTESLERERATAAIAAERAVVTRQSLIEEARAVLTAARESGQNSAAIAAIKEIGVLAGVRIERSERGAPGEFDWVEKLTVAELQALARGDLDIEAVRQSQQSRSVN
jgi:hypothetical protein